MLNITKMSNFQKWYYIIRLELVIILLKHDFIIKAYFKLSKATISYKLMVTRGENGP